MIDWHFKCRLRDRAEELDLRAAEEENVQTLSRIFHQMKWDPGPATEQRLKARIAEIEREKVEAARRA